VTVTRAGRPDGRSPTPTPAPASPPFRWPVLARSDLLALLGLVLALVVGFAALALTPLAGIRFTVDRLPPGAALDNFYPVEHNAAGPFRWSQPAAALHLPRPTTPGSYRVTLTMQDTPQVQPPRAVIITIAGQPAETVALTGAPRDYTFVVPGQPRDLRIALATTPFQPRGDARTLGVIVTHASVTPAKLPWLWFLARLLPDLLALGAAFVLLRALRFALTGVTAILGVFLAADALVSLASWRASADALRYQPLARPLAFAGALLLCCLLVLAVRRWTFRVPVFLALVALPTAEVGALLRLIWSPPLDLPFSDEWATVKLVLHAREGILGWNELWAFHNMHRILIPRLIFLATIALTGWNRIPGLLINLLVVAGAWVLLIACLRRTTRSRMLTAYLAPLLALLLFAISQYENWLMVFQVQYFLPVFGMALALWALTARPLRWPWLALAIAGAAIASLSSLHGLAVWFACIPLIVLAGWRKQLVWTASALALLAPYSIGFPRAATAVGHPLEMALFLLAYLGAPVGTVHDLHGQLIYLGYQLGPPHPGRAQLLAVGSIALLLINLWGAWRYRRDLRVYLPWLCLALFALACAAMTASGRQGYTFALVSRYHTYSLLWWVALGVIGTLTVTALPAAVWQPGWRSATATRQTPLRWPRALALANVLMLVLASLGFAQANLDSLAVARQWKGALAQRQECVRHYATAPDSCFLYYFPLPAVARVRTVYLAQQRLSIFRHDPAPAPVTWPAQSATPPDLARLRPLAITTVYSVDRIDGPLELLDTLGQRRHLIVAAGQPYTLTGWALDAANGVPAGGVFVTIDNHPGLWASYGAAREEPVTLFGIPFRPSGFRVSLPALSLGQHSLRLIVVSRDFQSYYQPTTPLVFEAR
jgi:hypothetical protein